MREIVIRIAELAAFAFPVGVVAFVVWRVVRVPRPDPMLRAHGDFPHVNKETVT